MNSINDDMPPLNALAVAYEALREAERQHYDLTARLDNDAHPRDLGGQSIDARISAACGEVERRRYEYDRAVCSLMRGEAFTGHPSKAAMQVEMQARAHRQVNGRRFDLLRTAMAAVDAAPADAPLPAPERKPVRDFAGLEAGFISAARA